MVGNTMISRRISFRKLSLGLSALAMGSLIDTLMPSSTLSTSAPIVEVRSTSD
jgi:hypothetical protein